MAAVCFLIGISLLHLLPALPPVALAGAAPLGWFLGWRLRGGSAWAVAARVLGMAAAGFGWALLAAHQRLDTGLDPAWEGRDLVVTGRVADLPRRLERALRFELVVDTVDPPTALRGVPGLRLRLSDYGALDGVRAGERWRLVVRLKRPHGFRNPGAFDYERWLFARGIRATGYVRRDARNRRLQAAPAWHPSAWREALRGRLQRVAEGLPNAAFLPALALGDRSGLAPERWRLLLETGTNHLLAISGLHVGMVAALAGGLLAWGWRRVPPLALRLAAPRAGALGAVVAAAGYATLAGWSVPTQRAFVMVSAVAGALFLGRGLRPWRGLGLALFAVLLLDPFAPLSPGFWLSFGAVAVLIWAAAPEPPRGPPRWLRAGRATLVVGLGLLPLTLWFFQRAAPWGPLANLWAIPVVTLVTVPAALMGTALLVVSQPLAYAVLAVADASLQALWPVLEAIRGLPGARWDAEVPGWAVALAVPGLAWALAPRGWPARPVGLVLLLPLFWPPGPQRPAPGAWEATMLDVGQGLSVVVRTTGHTLVFDTGPRFSARFNAAEAAVIPALRALGVRRLDALVISHGDSDHAGGLRVLLEAFPPGRLWAGDEALGRTYGARRCLSGVAWAWDGVRFTFLHPPENWNGAENDRACVLRVEGRTGSLLLASDIEAGAERRLAALPGVAAEVLQVPHHGSATSSTPAFLEAVRPQIALFSVGYRNRWGFPRPEVVARYRLRGSTVFETASCGAITVTAGVAGPVVTRRERLDAPRYWALPAASGPACGDGVVE